MNWAFLGIISGGLVVLVKVLTDTKSSIIDLNSKMAVLLEKLIYQQKDIDRHEKRIDHLEKSRYHSDD